MIVILFMKWIKYDFAFLLRVTIHYELEYTSVTFFVIIERVYCVIALYYHIVEFWWEVLLILY